MVFLSDRDTLPDPDQLAEIQKVSLARVMCDNMDNIQTIQRWVMLQPRSVALAKASYVSCTAYP